MSETIHSNLPMPEPAQEAEYLSDAQHAFEAQLGELVVIVPEIQARPEIMEAGKELVSEFDIKPSLFEDRGRSVVFTGIASRWAEVREKTDESSYKEKVFLANTIALLAHEHSDALQPAHEAIKAEDEHVDAETAHRVYEKYTDKQLSEAVKNKIAEGFLNTTKQKLGITPENEDEYDLRVLSIGDDAQTYGLDAPAIDYSLPFNHPNYVAAVQLADGVKDWKRGLEARSKQFANELGLESVFAPAWVTDIKGKRTLCITSALAEKVLDPDVIENTNWYNEDYLERDLAILAHEYTHTQGGIILDNEVTFGINIEELRAEHFSGNKQGYQDIKGFFADYRALTGEDVASEFGARVKGGTAAEVYGLIANRIGLSKMVELILASPNNYVNEQTNSYRKEVHAYIGGFDGVEKSILEAEIKAGNGAEIEQRITSSARRILEIAAQSTSFDIEFWANYRNRQGLNVVTDLIAEQAKKLQQEQAT